jgi:two-component system cell cycle sensor histidine kinase/response regulator CckA
MVEDDPLDAELVLRELEEKPDLILSDYNLPAFDGLRALEVLKSKGADIPFIIISGKIGEELAVRAMKEGAADYLIKDRLARLGESVRQTLKQHRLRIEHERSEAEREQLEQQLRRAEKLELVGRVVTGVAHDINNLLSTMTSYPEIIRSELGSDHPMSDLAAAIEEAANRASNLTRHLLAFSSSREGESMLLDVNQVASDLEKILRRVITDTIDLQLELDPNLNLIMADSTHVEQILMNLVVNARDAMPDGGRILIETKNLSEAVDGEAPAEYVTLAVTDTGHGIPEDMVQRIFDPFFTTKENSGGTGLGLATCQRIAKSCGGCIKVESVPGKGSTFRVYFPAQKIDLASLEGEPPMEEPPR